MIREILSLPEPERTSKLEELPNTDAIKVYSRKTFPVRFYGKIINVKAGENAVNKDFGIYLIRKYPELSETPFDQPAEQKDEPARSSYFEKLVGIKGIGEKLAEDIEEEYPTPADLIEAVKADRLPKTLARFADTFTEVFK